MTTVKRDDLRMAFEFVSSAPPSEHAAFVSLDTGTIYWISSDGPVEEDEVPDDLETSDRYLAVPHKNDLDLGSRLAVRFAAERLPHRAEAVREIFCHRGAYARFKALLHGEGRLDEWYAFEEEATTRALEDWCDVNGIQLA